jgi:hypothetical protein
MTIDEYEEVLKKNIKIVEHHNNKDQFIIWIEEMSELTKELCKWYRVYDELEGDITPQLLENIKEEVTDVTVSLDQIKYKIHFIEDELMEYYKFKVDRENKRMENKKNDKCS